MPEASTQLARRAGSVAGATLISRLLGLVREQVIATVFGAGRGPATDVFLLAFRIPNLLRDLFAEGALSAAFVPNFTAALREDRARAWRLFNVVLNVLVVLLGLITVGIVVFAPEVVTALATGYGGDKRGLAALLTRITAPFLVLVSLAALSMGALNACGRFFVPSLSPALFNVAMIACALALPGVMPRWGLDPVAALAVGAVAGGALQLVVQLPLLWRAGYRYRPVWDLKDPGLVRIARMMGPAVIGMAIVQVSILIDTQFASQIPGDGPLSWLNFAFRIMYLPIGVVGVGIGTAHLVEASRHAAAGDTGEIRAALGRAVRLTAALALPAMAGLIALRVPVVRLLYEHGRFTPEDTQATAGALLWFAAAILTYSAIKIFVPTFYAMGETRVPLAASAGGIAVKIAASALLVGPMGHAGLALSTMLATVVNAGILGAVLRRRVGCYTEGGGAGALARMAVAAAAMGGVVFWLHGAVDGVLGHATLGAQSVAVAASVAAGALLYGGLCLLLRVGEAGGAAGRGGGFRAPRRAPLRGPLRAAAGGGGGGADALGPAPGSPGRPPAGDDAGRAIRSGLRGARPLCLVQTRLPFRRIRPPRLGGSPVHESRGGDEDVEEAGIVPSSGARGERVEQGVRVAAGEGRGRPDAPHPPRRRDGRADGGPGLEARERGSTPDTRPSIQAGVQDGQHLVQKGYGRLVDPLCMPTAVVEGLDLVHHDEAGHQRPGGDGDMEGVIPIGAGDGAGHDEAGAQVEQVVADDQGGPSALLFVA